MKQLKNEGKGRDPLAHREVVQLGLQPHLEFLHGAELVRTRRHREHLPAEGGALRATQPHTHETTRATTSRTTKTPQKKNRDKKDTENGTGRALHDGAPEKKERKHRARTCIFRSPGVAGSFQSGTKTTKDRGPVSRCSRMACERRAHGVAIELDWWGGGSFMHTKPHTRGTLKEAHARKNAHTQQRYFCAGKKKESRP